MSHRNPAVGWIGWLRSLVFAAWMFGLAMVMGVACLPLLLASRRSALAPVRLWARWVVASMPALIGLRVAFRGEPPPPGAALVAAKHQGMLDVLAALVLFPDPCIVMKKELMWIPIFGWFSAKSGMIMIDRSAGSKAVRAMTHAAQTAKDQGRQLLIFPEGTRRAPLEPPDYKPGLAGLYRELALPCTPLATNSGCFWPALGVGKRPGLAVFEFLAPIPPGRKRAAFMAQVQDTIEAASIRLATPPPESGASRKA